MESLRAILLGGVAFDAPEGNVAAAPSAANQEFPFYANTDAAQSAIYGRRFSLIAYFPGSVRGLAPGADVVWPKAVQAAFFAGSCQGSSFHSNGLP